jgi:hypothetical protein
MRWIFTLKSWQNSQVASTKMREMEKNLWPILVRSTVQPAIDLIVVCE